MKSIPSQSSNLKWQLLALAGLVSVLLIFLGYVYYQYEEKEIRDDKYTELNVIAKLKINQILQWRNERLGDAIITSQSALFNKAVKLALAEKDNLTLKTDILNQLSIIKKQYGYDKVFIISPDGDIVLSPDPNIKYPDSVSVNYVRKAFEQKEVVFTDFYFLNNQILIDIIAPLTNNENKPIAALIFQINPSFYIYPLIQSWPTPSKTAETLLIRKDGDRVLYVNELRHLSNTALKLSIPLTNSNIPAVQAVLGHVGIWEGNDYRSIEVLSDLRPVPGTPWFMVAKIDKSEIYAELYYRAFVSFIFVILLILLLGAALAWFYNTRQNKTYRELLLAEKNLHHKENEFRTALYSIGDGIITTDLNGCVRQMNNVAEQLTGWSELNATGKKLDEVFRIINEGTRKTVENPVAKVLREGLTVGLANHTLLISAEGKETPIADSGAPIKSDSGEISGVVLVFRDQISEREAEIKLMESEEKFRNVFEHSVVGISTTSMDGKLRTNNAFCIILGYTQDELSHLKWQHITYPDDIEFNKKIIESIISGQKETARWEKRYIHKNGNIVWADISTSLLKDSNNNPLYFITTINDITQRKQAEIALRDEKDQIRTILDLVGDPIFVKDNDHRIILANRAFYNIFCLDESSVIGLTLVEAVPENERQHFLKVDRSVLDTGIPDIREEELTVGDNKYYIITRKTRFTDESGNKFLVGSIHNITERKLAEESLNRHTTRLQNLHRIDQIILQAIESPETIVQNALQHIRGLLQCQRASVGIFDFENKEVRVYAADIDGKSIVQVGITMDEEMYGVVDILRHSKIEIVEDMSKEASPSLINKVLQAEGIQSSINVALISAQAMYGVLNIGWETLRYINQEESDIVSEVASQITIAIEQAHLLRKTRNYADELEQRVVQRTEQLELANKELEAFSYSVSHDLRAPLRHISGFISLFLQNKTSQLTNEELEYLDVVVRSSEEMGKLIDALLSFSRLNRSELTKVQINTSEMINRVIKLFSQEIQSRSIRIDVGLLPDTWADRQLINQVWTNLISNSIKYTGKKEKAIIEIGGYLTNNETIFFIKDNGAGFNMKYANKLFTVFQRLHKPRDFEGIGIGLANIHRIVSRHGGRCWAEGEINSGATFYFSLPAS